MIVLPNDGRLAILSHAQLSYPNECCGLLAGHIDRGNVIRINQIVPSDNVTTERRADRFEIDPQVRFDLMRALEGTNQQIVGHYHSHPDGPAAPSATDRSMAFEPDLVWLICRVTEKTASPLRAWRIEGGPDSQAPLTPLPLFSGGLLDTHTPEILA